MDDDGSDDDNAGTVVVKVLPIILTLLLVTIVTMLFWMKFGKKPGKYITIGRTRMHHCRYHHYIKSYVYPCRHYYEMSSTSIQSDNPLYEQYMMYVFVH